MELPGMRADPCPTDEHFSARFAPVVELSDLSVQLVRVQVTHYLVANFALLPAFQLARG